MKRFMAFQGSVYYPCGGMSDFYSDFDTLSEAMDAVVAYAKSESVHEADELWRYSWAHVYDSIERRIVWNQLNEH